MDTLVVYSSQNGPRIKYVLDWLLKERLHLDYVITTNKNDLGKNSFFISYGAHFPNSISIPDVGLLWQRGKEKQKVITGKWNELPSLFALDGEHTIKFDLFSAIFFLLSRYEEYYPFTPDKHGRYPATESILYKQGWLSRPLVDEWVSSFRKLLQAAVAETIDGTPFLYQPTYDIDMAYAHLHKGIGRIAGAYLRAIVKFDLMQITERIQVFKNKQKDPFDSFRFLRQLHHQHDCRPVYFILSAGKTTAFDKNIHPEHPAMTRIIKNLSKEGEIGIHPSYYSDQGDVMGQEKKMLERIAGHAVSISRQHYIKVKTPDTYRLLLQHNIDADYSMGYGAHLGFRAGTGSSFLWYDLEQETIAKLRVYPFCFMDTTAHFELKLSVSQAFKRLEEMSKILEQTGSMLITIFHNFSLGTSSQWRGWRQAYEHFLEEKTIAAPVKEYIL
jgi:hypothetical protein